MIALLFFYRFAIIQVLHLCVQLQVFLLFFGVYLLVLPKGLGDLGVWGIQSQLFTSIEHHRIYTYNLLYFSICACKNF